ncbi:MAG: cell division protein FtsQ/DivIB [Ilumatobacteraceae bacterium]
MTEHEPDPDSGKVPDAVLDELQAAFSPDDTPPKQGYDFDDPSIDRLLGLDEVPDEDVPIEPDEEQPPAAARKTIVIEHEEVPDTVYLDDEQEERFGSGGDERSTVVIGDLDDGPAVQPAPSVGSAGGMDPRIRARRIANRRAEGRRRLFWVAIASGVVLLLVAAIAVVASPIFDVRDVQVQGAVYTDPDVLNQVIDDMTGEPLLLVDTDQAERTLEGVAWVERATVTADFPHTVRIDIRERRPVATFQGSDQQYRVIDREGRVLDVIDGRPIAYPLIVGDNPDTDRGQFAGAPYAGAAQLVLALPPDIRKITKAVSLDSTTGTLGLVLASPDDANDADIEVAFGDDADLDDKLARLLYQVRSGDGLTGVCSIDVSTAEVGVVPGC